MGELSLNLGPQSPAQHVEKPRRTLPGSSNQGTFAIFKRVKTVAPEVSHNLHMERIFSFQQFQIKDTASFKSMFLKDALAKTVNGVNAGFINAG